MVYWSMPSPMGDEDEEDDVSQPEHSPVPVDLTQHAPLVQAHLDAQREADRWEEIANVLKQQIQTLMGESTHATCNGEPAYTWKQVGKLNVGRLRDEQPDLYATYFRQKTIWELDQEALKAELPKVYEQYRGRVFNRLVK